MPQSIQINFVPESANQSAQHAQHRGQSAAALHTFLQNRNVMEDGRSQKRNKQRYNDFQWGSQNWIKSDGTQPKLCQLIDHEYMNQIDAKGIL